MKKLALPLFLLLLLTSQTSLLAQQHDLKNTVFSEQAAIEDIEALTDLLKSYHSGLFWYMSEQQFENKVQSLKTKVHPDMSEWEIYKLVNPLVAEINCGHTSLRPSSEFYQHSEKHLQYFPFKIKFLGERVFLDRQFHTGKPLPRGTEITKINGQPIQEIVQELLPQITSDGHIKTAKYRELEYWFPLFYARFIDQPDTFHLQVIQPQASTATNTAFSSVNWSAINMRSPPLPPASFKIAASQSDDDPIATLTLRSFDEDRLEESGIDYKKFLEKTFAALQEKKVDRLILDLRGNFGGNDAFGTLLFSYLAKRPFQYYSSIQLNPEIKESIPRGRRKDLDLQKIEGGYTYGNHPSLGTISPHHLAFSGELFVLIDGGSFSATAGLAAIIQQYKRGVFIGEETGGATTGNTSGFMLDAMLPQTGMRIVIPAFRYAMAVDEQPLEGRGVFPDYPIEATLEQWLSGEDAVMEYTLKLVERENVAQMGK